MIQLTRAGITTADGRRWPMQAPRSLVQAADAVYAVSETGLWWVDEDGPRRLADPMRFGGATRFADGVCFGVPASGYSCFRGPTALPPIGQGLEAVAPDVARERHGSSAGTLTNTVTGESHLIPELHVLLDPVRMDGDVVELFGPTLWYRWKPGAAPEPREYVRTGDPPRR
jgi:hypothetical protein